MKKLTLFLVATLFSALSFAALNPFAYGLTSSLNADQTTLTVNYSLNADATSATFVLLDGDKEILSQALSGITKGTYTATINLDRPDIPLGKKLNWRIDVKGKEVSTPMEHATNRSLYHPSAVDIDNNPENATFGLILVNEAMHEIKGNNTKAKYKDYQSYNTGAGIYAFNAAFEPIANAEGTYGFNGGIKFTTTRADGTGTAYAPRRIRISEDGRIFVTSLNTDGNYLWEVNPKNMNEWTPIFKGASINTDKEIVDASDNFIVGPNTGFDVKGSGENLKLMMYSVNLRGITSATMSCFKLAEYNLGSAKSWTTIPSKMWVEGKYAISYNGTQVAYDNEGGVWIASYRGTATETNPGLVHLNAQGVEDYKQLMHNVRNAGIRFNHDFTKLIIAGDNGAAKKATIFAVSKNASGMPELTRETVIDMTTVGNNLNDFAFDYAGNLYACGNSNEKIVAWAMPRKATDIVSTPCASKYEFTINSAAQMSKASELNPYAYNLTSDWDNTNKILTVNYTLNANATGVDIVILDGNMELKRVTCSGTTRGSYTEVISLASDNLPVNRELSWEVEVKGTSKDVPTQVSTYYSLYCPHGLAIDKDPESNYFGRILVAEAMQGVPASGYVSSGKGAGLYVFNPDFATDKKVHNGGLNFTRILASNGYQPWRVKISKDGRIFVSSLDLNGVAVWEVSKDLQTWTPVIAGTNDATDHNIYDAEGNFIAGLNCSMDVIGKGDDLKLLLYSTNNKGIAFNQSGYRLDEYALGTATTWTGTPKNIINGGAYGLVHTNVEFIYDGEGGYWFGASRAGNAGQPNLVHINAAGEQDYYTEDAGLYGGDGVLVHNGMLFKGKARTSGTVGNFGVWTIGKDADGKVTLTEKWSVVANGIGRNLNEFAVDFAENLYIVGNSGEKIIAFALPYSGTTTTPCATKFTFSIEAYTMTTPVNDPAKGSVTGAGVYSPGSSVTITATPAPGYKLLYWSDRSTENPRTITMTKNEAISAYFVKEYTEEPTFSIRKVWENTNVPASTSNGYQAVGWDGKIYMQDAGHSKIITFSDKADTGTEYATSGAGQQIAVDEAGNLIVFNATFYVANPNSILIYEKGNTTGKPISFTLPQPERCDFFSASGDIYSAEGGYVYFYCKTKQVVNRVKIANGELVSVDVVGNNITAGNTQNHVMLDIFGNLVAHSRSAVINATINVHTSESMAFTLQNHKYSTLGGCTFELGGKEFWAYNVGTTNYTSEWNIYNMTDKKFCSDDVLYAKDKISTNTAANWLNVQVVDENTAYIYQFCPKVGAAVWEVKMLSGNLHTVTVVADNGTVDGNAGTYEDGATATLTAKPNTGYKFVNWTKEGTVVSTDATYTFTVTEDVTLVANFEALPQYTITATSNDAAMGTVTGGGTYYEGTEVTLTASAVGGYVFSNWSDGNTDNPRTIQVTADATYTANFKVAIARVFAYNLDMIDNGDSYTFSFIPNANAISGRLIVYNDSKAQVLAQPITSSIVKGAKNEMTISKTSLPAKGTWAIELSGEPVESLTLLTKANDKTNYGFYRPQGVAIDNSPESDYFGRMYIALPMADGGYSDTNYGIVVMDPLHNRLKSGVVAYGDALGSNGRYSMHRIAVNPTNGHVYYVRTSDSSEGVTGTAIYELTPNATSILTDGGTAKNVISGVSEITNANSVCFDETGAMYVVANANYTAENGSTGRVYKVVDGNATLVTQSSRELASKDNSIVPDGKGGFWIAQHRNNLDGFNHLLHIDASGNANYTIDNATNTHLLPVQTYTSAGTTYKNASYRGQVAYYAVDENNGILAYGGGGKVSVFQVSYASGVPTLNPWQTISLFTVSTTAGINVDGLAFDYAGNLIVMSATDERMYQYALPTNNNTSIVPAKSSLSIGEVNKITYELNGGVWNKYGWTSKKDMYNAFIADWKAYSGSTRATKTYEEQYGIGKSNGGIPTTIQGTEDILGFMSQEKWAWLGQFLDAIATAQGTKLPSKATVQMRFALGNFFGEDNNKVGDSYVDAVDCSGDIASLTAFAPYWGQTFPMPTQPTEEVVLNAPYKEKGYEFDGWYTTSNFSGAEVTVVDENTNGTLYAKWTRNEFTRSVTSGRYGTICLPYNSNYFEGAIFYEVAWMNTSVSPWQVLVDEVTELEAGKPYIFMAKSNNILVACQGDAIANPSYHNGLYGTFTDINDGPAGTVGNVLEGNHMLSNNQIMKCLGNCQLLANRAYFKLGEIPTVEPALVPGRRRVALGVQGGNEATGLDNLTEDGIAPAMEGTYDVLGRKMTEPTNNGFYIVNGKKVVVLK